MGVLNENIRLGASAAGAYEIKRSLRFNKTDDTYLAFTPSSAGTTTAFTISMWVKRSILGTGTQVLFSVGDTNNDRATFYFYNDNLTIESRTAGSAWNLFLRTNSLYRDPSAWYHIVARCNSTNGTANLYVNGVDQTDLSNSDKPSGSQNLTFCEDMVHEIGRRAYDHSGNNTEFEGYITEMHFIDGQALDASSFAETHEDTGQWVPKKYEGSYGTTGFYLNFSDNSGTTATTLGKDKAGSNNFTPNNFSVAAGAGCDSVEDTPTNNFCTINPVYNTNVTYSNGSLDVSTGNADAWGASTFKIPETGKWFFECTLTSSNNPYGGQIGADYYDGNARIGYYNNGQKVVNGTWSNYGDTLTTNDVVGTAINRDDGEVTFYKNGTSQGTITSCFTAGKEYYVIATDGSSSAGDTYSFNFGQRAFAHSAPTGYKTLCSENLPEPAIIESNKHFDTKLYTGTGSSQTLTGLQFSPGITLIKKRNVAEDWEIQDSLRGATKRLVWNTDAQESTVAGSISAFTSDGFTVVDAGMTNENTHTYASFHWKAGSSAANTAGTINSTVSVNADAGISIVKYTGNGTAGATVGHGLGVAVESIWIKALDLAGKHWSWGSTRRGRTHWYKMSGGAAGTGGAIDEADMYNDTAPTSTVFSLGNDLRVNNSGTDYVAYCFSSVSGFSKVGSYVGNGSADGTFVHTGFTPKWIYFTGGGHRLIKYKDNTQQIGNPIGFNFLGSYNNAAEDVAGWDMDMLSNGFKFRGTDTSSNENTTTHYYVAFAESPFKYNRAQ